MYKHIYCSLYDYDLDGVWVYRLGFEPGTQQILALQSIKLPYTAFDTREHFYHNGKLAIYGEYLWVAGEREVIRLKLDNFDQVGTFTHYDSINFTDIVPTDGGTLIATKQGRIQYLNPFGEFFHLRDLKAEHPVVEGMMPTVIRPPITWFTNHRNASPLTHFPQVVYNSDHPNEYINMTVNDISGLVYFKDSIVAVEHKGIITRTVHGQDRTDYKTHLTARELVASNNDIQVINETPHKNRPTTNYIAACNGPDSLAHHIYIIQDGQLAQYLDIRAATGPRVNVLDVIADPRDKGW